MTILAPKIIDFSGFISFEIYGGATIANKGIFVIKIKFFEIFTQIKKTGKTKTCIKINIIGFTFYTRAIETKKSTVIRP